MAIKGCIEKAVDKAVKDVNAPMLTQLRLVVQRSARQQVIGSRRRWQDASTVPDF